MRVIKMGFKVIEISLLKTDKVINGIRWEYSCFLHEYFRHNIKACGAVWNGKYWNLNGISQEKINNFIDNAKVYCEKKEYKLKTTYVDQNILIQLACYILGDEIRYHLIDSAFVANVAPLFKVRSDFMTEDLLKYAIDILAEFDVKVEKNITIITSTPTPLHFSRESWKINIHIDPKDIYHRFLTEVSAQVPVVSNDGLAVLSISMDEWEKRYKAVALLFPIDGLMPDQLPEPTPMGLNFNKIPGWLETNHGNVLREYQKEGVLHMAKCHGRALLADEMGTGKTVQTLAFCAGIEAKRVLIVCPSNAKYVWDSHIRKWLDEDSIFHLNSAKDLAQLTNEKWIICSYQIIAGRSKKVKKGEQAIENPVDQSDQLLNCEFTTIIFDEAHYLKSKDSKRSKAAKRLSNGISNVLLLTGTPIRNRIDEYKELISHINNDARYSEARKFYMLRRQKVDILKELPDKTREWINFDLGIVNYTTKKIDYDNALLWAESEYFKGYETSENQANQKYLAALSKAISLAGAMKAEDPTVFDQIKQVIKEKGSCLVFCKHHIAIDILAQKFQDSKITYVKIDGRFTAEDRKHAENTFQNGQVDVFLGSIGAAGEALTLTRADTCIFVEFDWVPAAMLQAEDRGHRIGQKADKYTIIYMYVDELETDKMMVHSLSKKIEIINTELSDSIDFQFDALGSKLAELKRKAIDKGVQKSKQQMQE